MQIVFVLCMIVRMVIDVRNIIRDDALDVMIECHDDGSSNDIRVS